MSLPQPKPKHWTAAEILEWEEQQAERYEHVGGVVRMMVGGTIRHNVVTLNLAYALRARLRGTGCRVTTENVKVLFPDGDFAYPDVAVSCRRELLGEDRLTDAVLVAEVLSRTTAHHDRGAKWDAYRTLPGLQTYVLVAQDEAHVGVYRRTADGWSFREWRDGEAVLLDDVAIPLEELYEDAF